LEVRKRKKLKRTFEKVPVQRIGFGSLVSLRIKSPALIKVSLGAKANKTEKQMRVEKCRSDGDACLFMAHLFVTGTEFG
jgi:hypothetical protein